MTRVDHKPVTLRVEHDCGTHETRVETFTATATHRYENGNVRYVMTRCDGTQMDAWHGDPGVEVITNGATP